MQAGGPDHPRGESRPDWRPSLLGSLGRSRSHLCQSLLALQLTEVRDYNRAAEPLGVITTREVLESEQDEGLTSDSGGRRRLPTGVAQPSVPLCGSAHHAPALSHQFELLHAVLWMGSAAMLGRAHNIQQAAASWALR